MTGELPLEQPRNCKVISLRSIIFYGAPILHEVHDADDHGWQFLTLEDVLEEDASIVSLEQIVELDRSVLSIIDLPRGWRASRQSTDRAWIYERSE
ncbi:MAG: hypothetical protein AAF483_25150 [Planctomycetota bacterium]